MRSESKIQLNAPAGKASVSGSVVAAFRLKNRFLSLLQRHIAYRLEIEDKSVIK
jgi:hypothetical protein